MLVLHREVGESLIITSSNGDSIRLTRTEENKIGIEGSPDMIVMREELLQDETQETQGE